MNASVFLATTGNGLARATRDGPSGWVVQSPIAGRAVSCLAAAPENRSIVYAGTRSGEVLRSQDRGATWQALGQIGNPVKSIAANPQDPRRLYAGTKPAYLYVSGDGGRSWEELQGFRRIPWRWWWFSPAEPPWQAYVQAIAISPTDPDVLLAGIEFGAVVRSSDGGQTWTGHRRGALRDCHTLKFHASNGSWAYEAGGTGGGAAVSRNAGETWQQTKDGLERRYGVACAADPAQPEIWYVSVASSPMKIARGEADGFIYRSVGGAAWERLTGGLPQPMHDMPVALVTDPTAPGHLYAGLTNGDVWFSANHGDDWQQLPLNLRGVWIQMLVL